QKRSQIHERLEMCSQLNALSHAPELAYRKSLPTPYKGILLQRVHTPQATQKPLQRLIKLISKQAPVNPDLISPGQRWRYCYRMYICPFYSTMSIPPLSILLVIYSFA